MSLGSLGGCLVTGVTSSVAATAWLRRASRDLARGAEPGATRRCAELQTVTRHCWLPAGTAPSRGIYTPIPSCSELPEDVAGISQAALSATAGDGRKDGADT